MWWTGKQPNTANVSCWCYTTNSSSTQQLILWFAPVAQDNSLPVKRNINWNLAFNLAWVVRKWTARIHKKNKEKKKKMRFSQKHRTAAYAQLLYSGLQSLLILDHLDRLKKNAVRSLFLCHEHGCDAQPQDLPLKTDLEYQPCNKIKIYAAKPEILSP